jgi:hypothetical protein
MVRMQIQFTDEQAQALKRAAAERKVSVAALAREAVDRLLIETGDTTSDEARAAALAIMGKFESDRSDVARNHDRYLAEIYGQRG